MRRRVLGGLIALVVVTGLVLVIPVITRSHPKPHPVAVSSVSVDMGSVDRPAPAAVVREGTSKPVPGVAADAPVLRVEKTHTRTFSAVGVTWAHDPAVTDTVVQIRVQRADGTWGSWSQVNSDPDDADAGPQRPGVRGGTTSFWTGPSTGVQAELTTRSGAVPTDVQLDLIDPGTSDADAGVAEGTAATSSAHAATIMPPVHSRADWGADPKLMTWDPEYAPTQKAVAIHHTDDTNNYTQDQVPAMIRAIYQFHAVSRGWGDIGYNVIADKFGGLWEGRTGGLASTVIGAHTGGFNTNTFGISMLGNYDTADTPQVMLTSVEQFIAWKFSLYGVNPQGSTTLISGGGGTDKWPAGQQVPLPTVFGHRDTGNTVCPGQYGYARLPQVRSEVAGILNRSPSIASRYASDPELQALLGAPAGAQQTANGVIWQVYANGRMYDSPRTGVHYVVGSILADYLAAGGAAALGAPTTDELTTPDGVGRYSVFAGDTTVYWTPALGAHLVKGSIRASYGAQGYERGTLGYPTSDELAGPGGSRYSTFEHGTIVWTQAGGARSVLTDIDAKWQALGGVTWAHGLPTTSTTTTPDGGGKFVHFADGSSIYWSATTQAHLVLGSIRALWAAQGWERGALGYPTSDELAGPGGSRYSTFEHGTIVWTAAGGAHAVVGPIDAKWQALGGVSWPGGLPTTSTITTPDGVGKFVHFTGGSIYWSPATGAHAVPDPVRGLWAALGWETGVLGYPSADETVDADGTTHVWTFQKGAVYSDPSTGTHDVYGAIWTYYTQHGGPGGDLGLPTVSEYTSGTGLRADFQHGSLSYDSRAKQVTFSPLP